jgi:hypothetical protein
MRNKKSVLMTLNHNCGYFSTVAGIAGNGWRLGGRFNAAKPLL